MSFPDDMQEKEYRHGLINAQIEIDLPFQIRALRKQQDLTQPELAGLAGMKQSRISKMEKPGGASFTLETLRRLAKAFDVALIVRFARFGELVKWSKEFQPDSFVVPSFDKECQALEEHERVLTAVRSEGELVTIARPRIRQSRSRRHGGNPKRFSAIQRKPPQTQHGPSLVPLAAGGRIPSGSNNTSSRRSLVSGANECTGYAGGWGGLNGDR
jgi:transcriptional regulator with XRE-family HTH domain